MKKLKGTAEGNEAFKTWMYRATNCKTTGTRIVKKGYVWDTKERIKLECQPAKVVGRAGKKRNQLIWVLKCLEQKKDEDTCELVK